MKIFYIIIVSIILSCTYNKRNKKYHTGTTDICPHHHLYVETYTVFAEGGAIGGTMASDYLTDSVSFRIYIGTFEEGEETYLYKCADDSIKIEKIRMDEEGAPYDTKFVRRVIERNSMNIKTLQKQSKFE